MISGVLEAARVRSRWVLFLTVALGTGHLAAVTVAALAGKELLGSAALARAPGGRRLRGRRGGSRALVIDGPTRASLAGLTSGYVTSIAGAAIGAYGIVIRSFPLLIVGTFLIGFGNSSNNLSRYAAADMAEPGGVRSRSAWWCGARQSGASSDHSSCRSPATWHRGSACRPRRPRPRPDRDGRGGSQALLPVARPDRSPSRPMPPSGRSGARRQAWRSCDDRLSWQRW